MPFSEFCTHHHIIKLLFIIPNKFANEESCLVAIKQIPPSPASIVFKQKSRKKLRVRFPMSSVPDNTSCDLKFLYSRGCLERLLKVEISRSIR
jgi:hypothetical protein